MFHLQRKDFQVFIVISFPAWFFFRWWCLQETPFEYVEGRGHSGSGTQGTLWSLQIWGAFFPVPRFSKSWKPCPARCLETRLLPVSHPAVASGDRIIWLRLELNLECFRSLEEGGKKTTQLAVEIKLLHPSCYSTHSAHWSCDAKTPDHDPVGLL